MAAPEKKLGVILFPGFELLDVFGPLEMLGYVPHLEITLLADTAGPVTSAQGPAALADRSLSEETNLDLLLVPGGQGTRVLVVRDDFLSAVTALCERAALVLSVCTGSALLARCGVLDGRRATTNKAAFDWVREQGPRVQWIERARWVWDEKYVTSSGVAAGIDMSLAVVEHLAGAEFARKLAHRTEYQWQRDPGSDPFARERRPVNRGRE